MGGTEGKGGAQEVKRREGEAEVKGSRSHGRRVMLENV
jgi:hypothetical protein